MGRGRLRAIVGYARDVYGLRKWLEQIRDQREAPTTSASLVAAAVLFCGLLRIRSFNALEPRLRQTRPGPRTEQADPGRRPFVRLVGAPDDCDELCSADTLSRSLRGMDLASVRAMSVGILGRAERNKVFREGWHGALRYVAIDGWEPSCSRNRHCDSCLVRRVKVKHGDELVEVEEYYHRYVVAMLIDDRFDMVLDIEPLLTADLRPAGAAKDDADEGELTAGIRLLRRVKQTFPWVDAVVADGLYPNGPFLTVVKQLRMGAVIITRKQADEPLKEALSLWHQQPPVHVLEDHDSDERIELWDCPKIQTLGTYDGAIRVVRGRVSSISDPTQAPKTWCMSVVGCANRLSPLQVLKVARGRWHIENTGFHQWTKRWYFGHVFVHDGHGMLALFWLFFVAFNLLTLFLYRQLRCYGRDRGKDVTQTISRLIDEMLDDLARLNGSPWDSS